MKLKRIISIGLMYLVLLSSTECFSSDDFVRPIPPGQSMAQVFEKSHDLAQEFRESIKFNLSEETKSDAHVVSHKPAEYWFNSSHLPEYNSYQRIFLSRKSSNKLFIDFGALII